MEVPTGVVGTGEAEPVEVALEAGEEAEGALDEALVCADEADEEVEDAVVAAFCLLARRAWRSLALTAVRRDKRVTRA
jgi:hypothetical protein